MAFASQFEVRQGQCDSRNVAAGLVVIDQTQCGGATCARDPRYLAEAAKELSVIQQVGVCVISTHDNIHMT